jgi:hypothetical protein
MKADIETDKHGNALPRIAARKGIRSHGQPTLQSSQKPGAMAIPEPGRISQSSSIMNEETIRSMNHVESTLDEHLDQTVQIDDAIVVPKIGIAEQIAVEDNKSNKEQDLPTARNKSSNLAWTILTLIIIMLICGAIIIGVCVSGNCQRKKGHQKEQITVISNIEPQITTI